MDPFRNNKCKCKKKKRQKNTKVNARDHLRIREKYWQSLNLSSTNHRLSTTDADKNKMKPQLPIFRQQCCYWKFLFLMVETGLPSLLIGRTAIKNDTDDKTEPRAELYSEGLLIQLYRSSLATVFNITPSDSIKQVSKEKGPVETKKNQLPSTKESGILSGLDSPPCPWWSSWYLRNFSSWSSCLPFYHHNCLIVMQLTFETVFELTD